jgi:IPT/TIG domain-containing protein
MQRYLVGIMLLALTMGACRQSTDLQPNPLPTLSSADAPELVARSGNLDLSVFGRGFVPGSRARWDGSDRVTAFVNGEELGLRLLSRDLEIPGSYTITVANPSPGGGVSGQLRMSVVFPEPNLVAVTPSVLQVGGGEEFLRIEGAAFFGTTPGTRVLLDSEELAVTVLSDGVLTAIVPRPMLMDGRLARLVVSNPNPGGGTSAALEVVVMNPPPVLSSISPSSATVGTPVEVVLTGNGFVGASIVEIDGVPQSTVVMTEGQLSVTVPTWVMDVPGDHSIAVFTPVPGGGRSEASSFEVVGVNPVPELHSTEPAAVVFGSPGVPVTLVGKAFASNATASWNGSVRPTRFVSATRLEVDLTAEDLSVPQLAELTVSNPEPGGGLSEVLIFPVNYPRPTLSSISPNTVEAGSGSLTLTLEGSNFVTAPRMTIARFGASTLNTSVASSETLQAVVPASLLNEGRVIGITVVNDNPGGGSSQALVLTVVNPLPTIAAVSPTFVSEGKSAQLTITGGGFNVATVVEWNGQVVSTQLSDANRVTAVVPESLISRGVAEVRVVNPAPGGGRTGGLPVTVDRSPLRTVAVQSVDLATDPVRSLVYASVPVSDPDHPNEVVAIDPTTASIVWSTFAGSNPQEISASDDGRYLYVVLGGASAVARIDLVAQVRDLLIAMPNGFRGEDIEALPGSPTSFVVSLRNTCCSPKHQGVALFDGDVMRGPVFGSHTGANRITAASGTRLYGYTNETTNFGFRRLEVEASRITQVDSKGGLISGFGMDIEYDAGALVSTNGAVLDPEPGVRIGTLAGFGPVRPDGVNQRAYFYDNGDLVSFSLTSFTELGRLSVPDAAGSRSLVRWGARGLALGGGNLLVIYEGGLVGS